MVESSQCISDQWFSTFSFGVSLWILFFCLVHHPIKMLKAIMVPSCNGPLGVVHKWRHALGGRGCQGFCDNITNALVMKSVTMGGGGVKNNSNLHDVIYGWPLKRSREPPVARIPHIKNTCIGQNDFEKSEIKFFFEILKPLKGIIW